jgi:hypothetical protein
MPQHRPDDRDVTEGAVDECPVLGWTSRLLRWAVAVYLSRMYRRLLAIMLLVATVIQGPALSYAATLGSSSLGDAITRTCGGQSLPDGIDCGTCCSHGAMASCATQCPVPAGAAVPLTLPASLRTAEGGLIVPNARVVPFADHDPALLLRPPIV